MVFDAAGLSFNPLEFHDSVPQEPNSEPPNPEAKKFYDLLSKAKDSLYKGCEKHSTLSAMSKDTNQHMTWHHEYQRDPEVLSHPSDGEAWKHFDRTHLSFTAEPRNVRLGLYADGFSPFGISSSNYSCWPVVVTPYNLPPWMCMKIPYIFLTITIPGPHSPKRNIDVFLEPIIDELIGLWKDGVETYDAFKRQNFQLKATLMWIVNDFLAYGMLSGWSTHGKLSCPYFMEKSKAFTLKHGRQTSFLTVIVNFCQGIIPFEETKMVLSRDKLRGMNLHLGYRDLPNWHTNLIRHNLDVMYVEKNLFNNIFNTIMDDNDKTKDNGKARQDVKEYCKRRELELVSDVDGKVSKLKASFSLTKEQKQVVLQWVKKLKFPDGYASNLSRCADVHKGKMFGMKNHDCHVFMERLLPISFREILPKPVWKEMTEILPSGFFDDMEHLVVHLSYEARVGGPVQYRWMYPLERIFEGEVKLEMPNITNNQLVDVTKKSFMPSKGVTRNIATIWKSRFTGAWDTWKKVLKEERDVWFNLFKNKYRWNPSIEVDVRRVFNKIGSKSFSDCMSKARKKAEKPEFMNQVTWEALYRVWRLPTFVAKSKRGKTARQSNKRLHTDGSILISEHKTKLREELPREPSVSELFLRCHQNKKIKVFVDATTKATWRRSYFRPDSGRPPAPRRSPPPPSPRCPHATTVTISTLPHHDGGHRRCHYHSHPHDSLSTTAISPLPYPPHDSQQPLPHHPHCHHRTSHQNATIVTTFNISTSPPSPPRHHHHLVTKSTDTTFVPPPSTPRCPPSQPRHNSRVPPHIFKKNGIWRTCTFLVPSPPPNKGGISR
nr:hypothetical protein [Tanacetum cinerariifolium]